MQAVIETDKLSKSFRTRGRTTLALDQLSFSVRPGEIFGYLGPNGAGKTTTIRLLLNIIQPSSGRALLFGQDAVTNAVALHGRIGFLPGELNLWKNQTAKAIIQYFARLRRMNDLSYTHHLTERLKLDTSKKMRDYSTGNKRKLGLVLALMHRPELLILDEPTTGLDPLMQQEFNQLMMDAREMGSTIFLSSHQLNEVQTLCDRVGILRDGQLKAIEQVTKLTQVEFRWVTLFLDNPPSPAFLAALGSTAGVSELTSSDSQVRMRLIGAFDPLLRTIGSTYIQDLKLEEPSLEEIFLAFYDNSGDIPQVEAVKEKV